VNIVRGCDRHELPKSCLAEVSGNVLKQFFTPTAWGVKTPW